MNPKGARSEEALARSLADYHEVITQDATLSMSPTDRDVLAELAPAQQILHWLEADRRLQTTAFHSSHFANSDSFQLDPTDGTGNLGRFRLIRELGRGGSGIVFLAEDPLLSRKVAIKIPRIENLVDEESRKRFQREAQTAAGLDHPNIVSVFESGEAGSVGYIVASYCEGPSLAQWLLQWEHALPAGAAAGLVARIAEALVYTHQNGIIHRDIKPGNVLLSGEVGQAGCSVLLPGTEQPVIPKLTDFGLARLIENEATQTRTGLMVGTPAYMSPEQASGRNQDIGPATDIYSMGVLLYELLSRRLPYVGATHWDTLRQILDDEPIPLRQIRENVPVDLEIICSKCMQKEPGNRYGTMQEMAEDLRRYLRGEPIRARAVTRGERLYRWARRKPALAALSLLCGVALVIVFLGSVLYGIQMQKMNRDLLDGLEREKRLTREATKQRLYAERREREAQKQAYISYIWRATQFWQQKEAGLIRDLLRAQWPRADAPDLRGFEWYYLWRLGRKSLLSLSVSPDGNRCAVGEEEMVGLWDSAGRECVSLFTKKGYRPDITSFTSDGKRLVIGWLQPGPTDVVEVRDLSESSPPIRLSPGHLDQFAIVPGKPQVVLLTYLTYPWNRVLEVWDYARGTVTRLAREFDVSTGFLCASPDGGLLGVTWHPHNSAPKYRIWDLQSHKDLGRFDGELAAIVDSPQLGQAVLVHRREKRTIQLLDVKSGKKIRTFHYPEERLVWEIAISRDGRRLTLFTKANRESECQCQVWDWSGSKVVRKPDLDEKTIRVASLRSTVSYLERGIPVPRGRPVKPFDVLPGPPTKNAEAWAVAFSPDGRTLAAGYDDINGQDRETFKLWDVERDKEQANLPSHKGTVMALAFSPDGKTVATGSYDSTIILWDVEGRSPRRILKGHVGPVRALSYSADGKTIASGGNDKKIRLWRAGSGELLATLEGHTEKIHDLQCHFARPLMASVSEDHRCLVWDIRLRKPVRDIPLVYRGSAVAFHPNGQWVVTGREDGPIAFREVDTGKRLRLLTGHSDGVHAIVFSPDGRTMASGCSKGVVRLWEADTGAELMVLETTGARINRLAFSPDGRILAGASHDGRVILWRALDRKLFPLPLNGSTGD